MRKGGAGEVEVGGGGRVAAEPHEPRGVVQARHAQRWEAVVGVERHRGRHDDPGDPYAELGDVLGGEIDGDDVVARVRDAARRGR